MPTTAYPFPPVRVNGESHMRKVGFELEFSGIPLADAHRQLLRFGASENKGSAVEVAFDHELGEFTLELDWSYIKKLAQEQGFAAGDSPWFDLLTQAASLVVPVEVVCPPIAMDDLGELDRLTELLRQAGAKGTEGSPIAAYGVHINTESPDLSVTTLYRYLLAFCLLQWWLVEFHQVDLARKLSPYVDLFPESFLKALIDGGVPASVAALIDLYTEHNPTRNRALDMLPILSWLDEERVHERVDSDLIKKRPAYHYRLPNCHIERPGWRLADEWHGWLAVEQLASRPAQLEQLAQEFRKNHQFLLGVNRKQWVERIEQWHNDL